MKGAELQSGDNSDGPVASGRRSVPLDLVLPLYREPPRPAERIDPTDITSLLGSLGWEPGPAPTFTMI